MPKKSVVDPTPQIKRFEMRASDEFLGRVDDWRVRRRPVPPRTEAIRMLCELGFEVEGIGKPVKRKAATA